jgi:hypothetical protein
MRMQFDLARCGRISKDDFFQIMCMMGDPLKPAEFERMLGAFGDAVDTKTDEVKKKMSFSVFLKTFLFITDKVEKNVSFLCWFF